MRIDVGWLLIFALISWSLASGYFPHVLPSQSPVAAWAQGLVAALLLFSSVLLHELAHALVALHHGLSVGGITLHVFGGVSQLETEPETPRAEMLIAVVGPLTSFGIAGLAYGAGWLLAGPPWADALASYLAGVNLVVGVFNLLPAFPLDGGRVLRAALWAWSRRLHWATGVAAGIGSALALLMVAVGIVRALTGEAIGGLWLAMIGLFLHQAARAARELLRVRTRLETVLVDEVMTTAPAALDAVRRGIPAASTEPAVSPRDSAWQAFLEITHGDRGQVAVVDNGALVGVVRQRDLHHLVMGDGRDSVTPRAA